MTRRTPLLVAAVLLAGLTLSPAQAAFPGQNGKIAFERGRDVWTMNSDGTNPTPLTTGGGTFDPAVGPGGSRIAFARGADIWVMNADGTGQTNLTGAANPATDASPAWSPDGSRIAFSRAIQGGGGSRIWVMDADGSNQIQLTTTGSSGDSQPAWAPDGVRIAYRSTQNTRTIYVLDVSTPDSGTPYHVPTRGTSDHPTWSPDGTAIAFQANRSDGSGEDVYQQSGPGGTPILVGRGPGASVESEPTWSPDGTRIAFHSNRSGTQQIWTVGAGGTEISPQNLSGAAGTDSQPDWGTLGTVEPALPPPTIGETLNAEEVAGAVTVKLPASPGSRVTAAGGGFIPLEEARQLPVGTLFNTRRGTVRLTLAASAATNATQEGTFRGGLFQTRQGQGNPLTELRMRGAGLSKCSRLPKGGAAAAGRRRSRSLFSRARGRFRTRGRNSTATVRGTTWVQKDTCKGTLTTVRRGSVVVRDLTKRRKITLKRGQKYLARAPKRR